MSLKIRCRPGIKSRFRTDSNEPNTLNFNFCKFAIFFADSKSRAQELFNNVSFVIFGHQTWDLEGGGVKLTPHPAYPGFQVPQQG